MKSIPLVRHFLTFTAIAGLVAGCASDNYNKSAKTATALAESSATIEKSKALIDQSLADLNDLVSNPNPDLRKQYQRFNETMSELGASDRDVAGKAEAMKTQGSNYFAGWDKELALIQNEDIHNRSEARRNEVAGRFDRMSRQYDEARTAFGPFMSDLRDVQKSLSTDLTAGGLASIKVPADKANRDAVPVKESLAKLSTEFKSLGLSMAPVTPVK